MAAGWNTIWNKLGSEEVARKIGFVIGVPETTYALCHSFLQIFSPSHEG